MQDESTIQKPDDPYDDIVKAASPSRKSSNPYDDLIEKHAADNNIDPNLIRAVMGQESTDKPYAVSPKGARGLMQLMPGTAARFGVSNIYDPNENIGAGAKYLKFLSDEFNGDPDLTLAGYNAGEGAVIKHGNRIPPYAETQKYVPAVKSRYAKLTGKQLTSPYLNPADDPYASIVSAASKPVSESAAPDPYDSIVGAAATPALTPRQQAQAAMAKANGQQPQQPASTPETRGLPQQGTMPGTVHLNPAIAPQVPDGAPRPFAPGEWVDNPDGSWSSEISSTIQNPDGSWSVVPGMWLVNGKPQRVDEDTATRYAQQSGLSFPKYKTLGEAEKFATDRESVWQGVRPQEASKIAPLWHNAPANYLPNATRPNGNGIQPDAQSAQPGQSFYGLETPGVTEAVSANAARMDQEDQLIDAAMGKGAGYVSRFAAPEERAKLVQNAQNINRINSATSIAANYERQSRERTAQQQLQQRRAQARAAMARAKQATNQQVAKTVQQDDTGHWHFDDPKTNERVYTVTRSELNAELAKRGYGVQIPTPKVGTAQQAAEALGKEADIAPSQFMQTPEQAAQARVAETVQQEQLRQGPGLAPVNERVRQRLGITNPTVTPLPKLTDDQLDAIHKIIPLSNSDRDNLKAGKPVEPSALDFDRLARLQQRTQQQEPTLDTFRQQAKAERDVAASKTGVITQEQIDQPGYFLPETVEQDAQGRFKAWQQQKDERDRLLNTVTPGDKADYARILSNINTDPGWFRALDIGQIQTAGRLLNLVAGALASGGPAMAPGADALRRKVLMANEAINTATSRAPLSEKERAAAFVSSTLGDLSRVGLLTTVLGPIVGMGVDAAAQAKGENLPNAQVLARGVGGAATGAIFEVAPAFETAGPDATLRQKLFDFAKSSAVVGTGTYGALKLSGASDEEATRGAVTNTLLHGIAKAAPEIGGRAAQAGTEVAARTKITPEWLRSRIAESGGLDHVVLREVAPPEGEGGALTKYGDRQPTGRALSAYKDPSIPEDNAIGGTEIDASKTGAYGKRGVPVIDVTPEQYETALKRVNSINPTEPPQISAPPPAQPQLPETASPKSTPPLPRTAEELTAPERAQEARVTAEREAVKPLTRPGGEYADPKQSALNALDRAVKANDAGSIRDLSNLAAERGASMEEIKAIVSQPEIQGVKYRERDGSIREASVLQMAPEDETYLKQNNADPSKFVKIREADGSMAFIDARMITDASEQAVSKPEPKQSQRTDLSEKPASRPNPPATSASKPAVETPLVEAEPAAASPSSEGGVSVPKETLLYHGRGRAQDTVRPGSMLTSQPEWAAGYTTKVNPADLSEQFVGTVHEVSFTSKNALEARTLHDAEQMLIDRARSILSREPSDLREAAEAVHKNTGADAIVVKRDGVITDAISLIERPVSGKLKPQEAIARARASGARIPENLARAAAAPQESSSVSIPPKTEAKSIAEAAGVQRGTLPTMEREPLARQVEGWHYSATPESAAKIRREGFQSTRSEFHGEYPDPAEGTWIRTDPESIEWGMGIPGMRERGIKVSAELKPIRFESPKELYDFVDPLVGRDLGNVHVSDVEADDPLLQKENRQKVTDVLRAQGYNAIEFGDGFKGEAHEPGDVLVLDPSLIKLSSEVQSSQQPTSREAPTPPVGTRSLTADEVNTAVNKTQIKKVRDGFVADIWPGRSFESKQSATDAVKNYFESKRLLTDWRKYADTVNDEHGIERATTLRRVAESASEGDAQEILTRAQKLPWNSETSHVYWDVANNPRYPESLRKQARQLYESHPDLAPSGESPAPQEAPKGETPKQIIEAAGYKYLGEQQRPKGKPPLQMFNDETGSTLTLEPDQVTPEGIKAKVETSRKSRGLPPLETKPIPPKTAEPTERGTWTPGRVSPEVSRAHRDELQSKFGTPLAKPVEWADAKTGDLVPVDGGHAELVARGMTRGVAKDKAAKIEGAVAHPATQSAKDSAKEWAVVKPTELAGNITKTITSGRAIPAWQTGRVLTPEQSEAAVQQIRAGDSRSKNEGRIQPESIKTPLRMAELPVEDFAPEYLDWLLESTNKDRVDRYAAQPIETPIYATPGKRGENKGKWTISDGAHRLLAAVKRGDKTIRALVPAEEPAAATTPVVEYKKKEPVQAEISDKAFDWKTSSGQAMHAAAGDWKVTHANGEVGSVKPDVFSKDYKPVEGKAGYYEKTGTTKAQQLTGPHTVESLEGPSHGKAGDYLVTGAKGEHYIVPKAEFEELYQPAAEAKEVTTAKPSGSVNEKSEFIPFPPEMGSLGIPRPAMPQIDNAHRGAMVNFLQGRGIERTHEDVAPNTLKPSQAEYNPVKVERARQFVIDNPDKEPRRILVSSDNYVVDAHHQWMKDLEDAPNTPIPITRLHAPANVIIPELARFPSSYTDGSHHEAEYAKPPTADPLAGLRAQYEADVEKLQGQYDRATGRVKELREAAKDESSSVGPTHQSLQMAEKSAKGLGFRLSAAKKKVAEIKPSASSEKSFQEYQRKQQVAEQARSEQEASQRKAAEQAAAIPPEARAQFEREISSINWESREERLNDESLIYSASQRSATLCTGAALETGHIFGAARTKIYGFDEEGNPTSSIARDWGGHDFAVIDDRFIVDAWLRETADLSNRIWFDQQDPGDADQIKTFYGDKSKWIRGAKLEAELPKEGEIDVSSERPSTRAEGTDEGLVAPTTEKQKPDEGAEMAGVSVQPERQQKTKEEISKHILKSIPPSEQDALAGECYECAIALQAYLRAQGLKANLQAIYRDISDRDGESLGQTFSHAVVDVPSLHTEFDALGSDATDKWVENWEDYHDEDGETSEFEVEPLPDGEEPRGMDQPLRPEVVEKYRTLLGVKEAENARTVSTDQGVLPEGREVGRRSPEVSGDDLHQEREGRQPVEPGEKPARRQSRTKVAPAPEIPDVKERIRDWGARLTTLTRPLETGAAPDMQALQNLYDEGMRYKSQAKGNAKFNKSLDTLASVLKRTGVDVAPKITRDDLLSIFKEEVPAEPKEVEPEGVAPEAPSAEIAPKKLPVSLAKRLLALPAERRTSAFGPQYKTLRREIYFTLTGNKPTDKTTGANAIEKLLAEHLGVNANQTTAGISDDIEKVLRQIAGVAEPSEQKPVPAFTPAIRKPAKQYPVREKEGVPRPVIDGQIETESGRMIPAPNAIRIGEGNRKVTNDVNKIDQWLVGQVRLEAEARGDDFNVTQFRGLNPKNLSPADKDGANLYLFGETNPVFTTEPETAKPSIEERKAKFKAEQTAERTRGGITLKGERGSVYNYDAADKTTARTTAGGVTFQRHEARFVTPAVATHMLDQRNEIRKEHEDARARPQFEDGAVKINYVGENNKIVAEKRYPVVDDPEVGLHPLEIVPGKDIHVGSRLVSVEPVAEKTASTEAAKPAAAPAIVENLYDEDYTGPRWRYGMRNRPPGPGAVPKGRILGADRDKEQYKAAGGDNPKVRWGTIDFPHELSENDVYSYELVPLGKVGGVVEKTSTIKPPEVGELIPVKKIGDMGDFNLAVKGVHGDKVEIGYPDSEYSLRTIPLSSYKQFADDLAGKVDVSADSNHAEINAVAKGEAEYLGKGDDGLAFKVGDKVVKVSTIVPYIPTNPFQRTPEQAVTNMREATRLSEDLRQSGVPGLLPTKFVEHDGRGFQIKPYVKVPTKMAADQIANVRKTLDLMNDKGYALHDEVQAGLLNGRTYLYDTGKATKLPDDERGRNDAFDDDSRAFIRFAEKMGDSDPLPLKAQAQRQFEWWVSGKTFFKPDEAKSYGDVRRRALIASGEPAELVDRKFEEGVKANEARRAELDKKKADREIENLIGAEPELKPGIAVKFTSAEPRTQSDISGTLVEVVQNTEGQPGYNILAPTEDDPGRVIRVWGSRGTIEAVPDFTLTPTEAQAADPIEVDVTPKAEVIVGDAKALKDVDLKLVVSQAQHHYTLWAARKVQDGIGHGRWHYIGTLGRAREKANFRARETANRIASGDWTGIAFSGSEHLRGSAQTVGLLTEEYGPDKLKTPEQVEMGTQSLGFGKYRDVKIDDLIGRAGTDDAARGYIEWMLSNANKGRMLTVANYIRSTPEYVASRDKAIETARDAVTPESLETLKAFDLNAIVTDDGRIYLGGKTYDWKETIKQLDPSTRYDRDQQRWPISAEGYGAFVEQLAKLPRPTGDVRGQRARVPAYITDPKLARLREQADGTPDRSGFTETIQQYIGADTAALINRGRKYGIPQDVLDEQIEDVARINRAYQNGEKMFLLASDPGAGKTFVAGAAIREMRKAGAGKVVYTTLRQELIKQIQKDLADYGLGDTKFITYPAMREGEPEDTDILTFDEAHSIKNIGTGNDDATAQAKQAKKWIQNSKFTLLMTATPFENPVQMAYLEPTGIFDELGGFENFALAFGASKMKVGKDTEILIWRRNQYSDDDQKAARAWLNRKGIFTSRRIRLPEEQVDARMVKVLADSGTEKMYGALSDAAAENEDNLFGFGKPWVTNFQKRILESSKVQRGIEEAEAALRRGRWPIIFVETKAERILDIPDLIRRQQEWERACAMTRQGERKPSRKEYGVPPPGVVETLSTFMSATGIDTIKIPSAEDIISKHFGDDQIAIFTGSVTPKKAQENLDRWRQKDKPMVLVATMAKGGTGLSLHDVVGDHQTTQININLPWSATQVVQVAQRSARYGLVGKAEMVWLFAENIPFDQMLAKRVGGRMADMGALVHGAEIGGARQIEDWDFDDQMFSEVADAVKSEDNPDVMFARLSPEAAYKTLKPSLVDAMKGVSASLTPDNQLRGLIKNLRAKGWSDARLREAQDSILRFMEERPDEANVATTPGAPSAPGKQSRIFQTKQQFLAEQMRTMPEGKDPELWMTTAKAAHRYAVKRAAATRKGGTPSKYQELVAFGEISAPRVVEILQSLGENVPAHIKREIAFFQGKAFEAKGRQMVKHAFKPRVDESLNSESVQVRAYGGVRTNPSGDNRGEIAVFKESGPKGLVNEKSGMMVEDMAMSLYQDGYGIGRWSGLDIGNGIDVPAALSSWIEDAAGSTKHYSTHYDPSLAGDPDDEAFSDLMADEYGKELLEAVQSGHAGAADIAELTRVARGHGLSDEGIQAFLRAMDEEAKADLSQEPEEASPDSDGEGYSLNAAGELTSPDGAVLFARYPPEQLGFIANELIQQEAEHRPADATREQIIDAQRSAMHDALEKKLGGNYAPLLGLTEAGVSPDVRRIAKTIQQRIEATGQIPAELSDTVTALKKLAELRRTHTIVADYLNQPSLFGERETTPRQDEILQILDRQASKYVDEIAPPPPKPEEAQTSLFGEPPAVDALFQIEYQHNLPGVKAPWQMTRTELSKDYNEELQIPNNAKAAWVGKLPPEGSWRMDPNGGALEQLQRVPLEDLVTAEDENDPGIQGYVAQYTEWTKGGHQAPPVMIVKHVKGHWVSINRRRVMAARAAGLKTILAWVSDSGPTGRPIPTHEDVVRQAVADGEQVPAKVLAEYPEIASSARIAPEGENDKWKLVDTQEDAGPVAVFNRGWETAEPGEVETTPQFTVEGNQIFLNEPARMLMSDGFRHTTMKYRVPSYGFGGAYVKTPEGLAQGMERLAQAEPARAEDAQKLAAAIREAGRDGPVRLSVGLPGGRPAMHEGIHEVSHIASGLAEVDGRHTSEGFDRLASMPEFETIKATLLERGETNRLPILIEEGFAYLASGDNLGLDDDQADNWMKAWIKSYAEKNGHTSVKQFKETTDAAQRAIAAFIAGETEESKRSDRSLQSNADRRTEGPEVPHGEGTVGATSQPRQGVISPTLFERQPPPEGSDLRDVFDEEVPEADPWAELRKLGEDLQRPAGEKSRRLPQTFEAAEMEKGTNLYYDPSSIPSGIELAKQVIADKGVDGAMEYVLNGAPGIEWAATGYEVLAKLRAQEQTQRLTDAAAADKTAEKRLNFLNDFVARSTKLGQAIAGVNAIAEYAPDRAAYILNKLSMTGRFGRRARPITQEEEARINELAEQLAAAMDQNRSLEEQIAYRIEVARSLEEDLAAAEARARRRQDYKPGKEKEKPKRPRAQYEAVLDEQAQAVKNALVAKIGNFNFGNLKIESRFPGQAGKVAENIAELPGDAELLAQYTASQLATHDTVADLNQHLVSTFGPEVEPVLSAVRQRAFQIRKDARQAELAAKDTGKERRRTILAEIQSEIAAARKAVRDLENAHVKAEKERKASEERARKDAEAAAKKAQKTAEAENQKQFRQEAREAASRARKEERQRRLDQIKEARQRAVEVRKEYSEASQAETKGWRATLKEQREAERTAELWDTPLRNAADEARARLENSTDPTNPEVMNDLVGVAAAKMLRDKPGGVVGAKAIYPTQFYKELVAEFPKLVNNKNKGEILKRAKQRIDDMVSAAREVARLRSASAESQKLWEKAGMDIPTQALLIQKAETTRKAQEARRRMQQEFQRVSRPMAVHVLLSIKNAPRSLQTSLNMHQGRQGMFALLTHPISVTGKVGIPQTLKGMTSWKRENFLQAAEELKSHRHFPLFVRAGGDVAEIPDAGGDALLTVEEDQLQSPLAMRLPHVRLSTQGFILGMNAERLALFSIWATVGEANGYTWENNPRFFQQAAQIANDASGRSTMPRAMKNIMGLMNELFYATRLNFSRVMLLNDLFNPFRYLGDWNPLGSGGGGGNMGPPHLGTAEDPIPPSKMPPGRFDSYDPVMRRIMVGNLIRMAIAMAALLLVGRMLGFHFYTDPDDPDTWKLVWRNHHTDLSGGSATLLKFAYRFVRAIAREHNGEKLAPNEKPLAIAWRFIRTKLAPWPTAIIDYLAKKNVVGEPANLKVDLSHPSETMRENILLRMLIPISIEETTHAFANDGWQGGVPATALQFLGFETQTYPRRQIASPSPAQKLLFERQTAGGYDDEEPEDKERRMLVRKLEDDIRAGKKVDPEITDSIKTGKLKPDDKKLIERNAQLSTWQLQFKRAAVKDAMDAYEVANPEERAAVRTILIDKGPSIQKMRVPEQKEAAEQFKRLTGQAPRMHAIRRAPGYYRQPNPSPAP